MREAELVVWAVTETIKIMIYYYGVLGIKVKNGWKKYGTFLYLCIGIPVLIRDMKYGCQKGRFTLKVRI